MWCTVCSAGSREVIRGHAGPRLRLGVMTHSHRFCLIRIRKALENKSNMEDDRVAILEAQLAQAKLIAEEADKKYEEVEFWGA